MYTYYLAGTVDHGLLVHQHSSSSIIAFSDADWVRMLMTENPQPVIVSILVPISSLGPLTNRKLFPVAVQKLNIVP